MKLLFLIKKLHEDLEVICISNLFREGINGNRKLQEDLVNKWADYIYAKNHAFQTKQIPNLKDDQIVACNNTFYLLTEADNTKEAINKFWTLLGEQSYKQLMENQKEEKNE